MSMTFEEFQRSKRWSNDLGKELDFGSDMIDRGWIYWGDYYVQMTPKEWDRTRADGDWYVILEQDDYVSFDLENLERQLYDFVCLAEGWTDPPTVTPGPPILVAYGWTYRVSWEVDVEADDAREAVEKARSYQTRPDTTAVVFTASWWQDGKLHSETIDLMGDDAP